MKRSNRKYYRIGEAAERYDLHPQTLRLYEREGLLRPSRSRGNARYYTEDDLRRLELVLTLSRELGVNLAGIEVILSMRERLAALQADVQRLEQALGEALARDESTASPGALVRVTRSSMVRQRSRSH